MATTYGTFDFASATTGGSQDFIYNGPNQTNTTAPVTSGNRNWTWRNGDTPSTGMGPTGGQGGGTEGYIYTEASDTGDGLNDVYTAEFDQNMNFATESFELTFYTNQRGDDNNVVCQVQINENGGGWTDVGSSFGGSGDSNKVATSGTDIWALRTVDLSNGGANTNSSTRMRIELTFPSSGTTWHNDYGLDTITVTGTDLAPIITDVDGDESIGVTQTNVVLTGSNLGTNTALAKVEISPNNTYAAGGLVQQTIDSWSGTSIQFDVVRTGLSTGTNYVWVTKSDGTQNATAFAVTLVGETPTITNVDGDNILLVDQTNIVIAGSNFGSAQGVGKVEISPNATYGAGGLVTQSIDSWSDTSIQFDLNRTGLSVGILYLYVTNNDVAVSANRSLTLVAKTPTVDTVPATVFGDTTGETIGGTNFGATDTGSAKFELGNASTYALSTIKVEQTVTSWSDTSLTADIVRGALSTGTVYAYVTNSDAGVNANGTSLTLSSVVPTVSSLDGDGGSQNADISVGDSGIVFTGTNFRAVKSSGKVEVVNNATYTSATVKNEQTTTSWSNTSVTFNLDNSAGLSDGTVYLFVTNGTGEVS